MATRKPASKSKVISATSKVANPATAKKVASTPAPESHALKDTGAAVAAPAKKKVKRVRDSFAMPKNEYHVLADLKLRSARLGSPAKKSDILRAGVAVLSKMSDAIFAAALDAIPGVKSERVKDSKKAVTKKLAKKADQKKTAKKKTAKKA